MGNGMVLKSIKRSEGRRWGGGGGVVPASRILQTDSASYAYEEKKWIFRTFHVLSKILQNNSRNSKKDMQYSRRQFLFYICWFGEIVKQSLNI